MHGWHIGDPRANEADKIATGWLMRPRGAYVMGRNMFGPIRGEWDEDWRGWWGPEPPYHAPVFVLTHHAHEPIEMEGGTTFHFVTEGFEAAYAQASETAGAGSGGAHPLRSWAFAAAGGILIATTIAIFLQRKFGGTVCDSRPARAVTDIANLGTAIDAFAAHRPPAN